MKTTPSNNFDSGNKC